MMILLAMPGCTGMNRGRVTQEVQVEFEWLTGTWSVGDETRKFMEVWRREGDRMVGRGTMLAGGEIQYTEELAIEKRNGVWVYLATVSDQNQGRTIPFPLVEREENRLVFENPEHDFPSRITYTRNSAKELLVVVEGGKGDEYRREEFPLFRE